MRYLVSNPQPSYLRLSKAGEPNFHEAVPNLEPGVWQWLRKGDRVGHLLLSTGATLRLAMEWSATDSAYRGYSVASLPLWGLATKIQQVEQIQCQQRMVAVEDHLADGGFGAYLLESLPSGLGLRDRIELRALNPIVCDMVGSQDFLNKLGGLSL